MKIAIIFIIVCLSIAIYASFTCNDVTNALALVKVAALKGDSCSVQTNCQANVAHQDITCKYTKGITEAEKSK